MENRNINLSRVADTAGCDVVRFVKCTPTRDREAGYIKELEGASEKFHRSCSMRGGLAVEMQSSHEEHVELFESNVEDSSV